MNSNNCLSTGPPQLSDLTQRKPFVAETITAVCSVAWTLCSSRCLFITELSAGSVSIEELHNGVCVAARFVVGCQRGTSTPTANGCKVAFALCPQQQRYSLIYFHTTLILLKGFSVPYIYIYIWRGFEVSGLLFMKQLYIAFSLIQNNFQYNFFFILLFASS